MSLLMNITESVQQVAEAIAIAVGVEVEIVDNELTLVGGTGVYKGKVGAKEEQGLIDGNFIYAGVLRGGETMFVPNTSEYKNYGMSIASDVSRELAELCTPIVSDGDVIGIIGLVAMKEEQKDVLIRNQKSMTTFLEKMADLLAAKAVQKALLGYNEAAVNELSTVLETTHEGIFDVDKSGYIKMCNSTAAKFYSLCKEDIIGSHLSECMPGSPVLETLRTGVGYTESEEVYKTYKGAYHFIVTAKPYYRGSQLEGAVISFRDIEEAKKLAYKINSGTLKYTFDDIIGESEAMRHVKNQAAITSRGSSTVLIAGESGTGKEMFAKAIHYSGVRGGGPFVTVNCGAIPENLLESELFGYEKGAFTGASDRGKIGKFERATGGTIFLDEIGDMPLHLQVKLLHVLQNMSFERLGGNKTIIIDVRVVAATNKDLESMIEEGTFREDLYYRLSVIPLKTPPLREMSDDIFPLMEHFLRKYNTFMGKNIVGFSEEARMIYESYDWPGNVRELENAVEYGVNMSSDIYIDADAIPERLFKKAANAIMEDTMTLTEQVRAFERDVIVRKLSKYGNGSKAKEIVAEELGLSTATLYRKITSLKI
ncbi:MAG: sigma 54-interacting transcriptional regulator [Clostridiales Family XIII bacterium]|nr:sigma 54-interacting transcriptional regulator [Clostridiales Family XIII bacterium]